MRPLEALRHTRNTVLALDPTIRTLLRGVALHVVPDSAALFNVVPDLSVPVRGIFLGQPAEIPLDDEDETPTQPPTGHVYIVADRHDSKEDIERTVLHELAHALGLDEGDVTELGL
jgi:Zincin-like metallopeptidase